MAATGHGGKPTRRRRRVGGGRRATDYGGGEDGAERWLVTYADMLTLLLVLFIVLFSISVVNISKYDTLRSSLADAFGSGQHSILDGSKSIKDGQEGNTPTIMQPVQPSDSASSADTPGEKKTDYTGLVQKEIENFKRIEHAINKALDAQGMHGAVRFTINRRGLIITVVTNALVFHGNSAVLQPDGKKILSVVAPPLRHITNNIEVDGHTNQQRVPTTPYPSGWELSSARASSVVRYLIGAGLKPTRLTAAGFSDTRPLYPVSDPRAIRLNRRVEIVVLSSLPADALDQLEEAANK